MAEKKSGWDAWRAKNTQSSSNKSSGKSSNTSKSGGILSTIEKTVKKKVKKGKSAKTVKKIHSAYIIIAVLFFVIGVAGGAFYAQMLVKDDIFELNGNKTVIYYVGDAATYKDEGVLCISMSGDISGEVEVTTDLARDTNGNYVISTDADAEFAITYTMKSGRYKDISLVRIIKVITMSAVDDEPADENSENGGNE